MEQVMEGHRLHPELFGNWYAGYKQYRVYTSTQCCGHSSTFHTLLHDARLADTCTASAVTSLSPLTCSAAVVQDTAL